MWFQIERFYSIVKSLGSKWKKFSLHNGRWNCSVWQNNNRELLQNHVAWGQFELKYKGTFDLKYSVPKILKSHCFE